MLNDLSKKVLSERFTNRRAKICKINIKVNFISWIVEFLGCMTIALNFLVVGSKNNAIQGLLMILTMLVFILILPCTFLVNSSAGINAIVDHSWFVAISRLFNPVQETEADKTVARKEKRKITAPETSKEKTQPIYTISNRIQPISMETKQTVEKARIIQRAASRRKIKIAWE